MRKILVFAERILPPGQTFIPVVVNALKKFAPRYIGLMPTTPSAILPSPPILLTDGQGALSRIRRELYRILAIAPRFHRAAKRESAALVHAHFAEGAAGAVTLSKKLNAPVILHLRGGAEMQTDAVLRRRMFEWSYLLWRKRLWKRTSRFLCVSNFIRDKALQAGFPESKLVVHYTGIDFTHFAPQAQPPERDRNLVLYVGRLVRYKGADHLVRAMQIVRRTLPDARLVLVGDGWFRPEVEALAAELRVPCDFLGDQPPAIVKEWMEKARVFCAPSLTLEDGMSEAFGNVFTEAQAMGLPVASYRHGGITETMLHGQTGLLANEYDVEGLAANLARFIDDDDFWEACHSHGMTWVRENFDVREQTRKLELLYEEVIAEHAGSRTAQK